MKKIIIIVGSIFFLLILVVGVLFFINSRPISKSDANEIIQKYLEKAVDLKDVSSGMVRVIVPDLGLDDTFVAGETNGMETIASQPFHVASVGKMFTASLIGLLVDDGLISFDDLIVDFLDEGVLEKLFVFDGVDFQNDVTIKMLLNHTSGVADYFGEEGFDGKSGSDLMLENPDQFWVPNDMLDFTRLNQSAVGPAGMQYYYSDTGFVLLGLIVENVMQMSFDEALHDRIFDPLGMNDSYLIFYSEPMNEIQEINEIWIDGVDVHEFASVSIDWAGGGVVSTLDDLVIFAKAFNDGTLLSEGTLSELYMFDQKFMQGIYYGLGTMEYRFDEFMPTLGFLPYYRGHMGILGTHILYDQNSGSLLIASFGSSDYAAGSVRTIIQILSTLARVQ